MTTGARIVPLPIYVSAGDVMRSLGCARSTAYWHLARAAGRKGGRGLLRVRADVWTAYAEAWMAGDTDRPKAHPVPNDRAAAVSPGPRAKGLHLVASNGERCGIALTQPKTKRKAPSA